MISSGRANVRRFGVTRTAAAAGLEHARDLGQRAVGVGHVLDRVNGDHPVELAVGERQPAHVSHDSLPLLALECARVEVHADGLARRQEAVAVADPAADVGDPTRPEIALAERVGGHVALPGRVEPALGGHHPLAGDGGAQPPPTLAAGDLNLLDGRIRDRCRSSRTPAHSVFEP